MEAPPKPGNRCKSSGIATTRCARTGHSSPPEGGDPITPADVYVHGQAVGLPKWQGWAKAAREKLKRMTEGLHFPHPAEPMCTTAA